MKLHLYVNEKKVRMFHPEDNDSSSSPNDNIFSFVALF